MDKEINFLGPKKKSRQQAKEERVEWTSPGPLLSSGEELKPDKGAGGIIARFFSQGKKVDKIKEEKEAQEPKENGLFKLKEKLIRRIEIAENLRSVKEEKISKDKESAKKENDRIINKEEDNHSSKKPGNFFSRLWPKKSFAPRQIDLTRTLESIKSSIKKENRGDKISPVEKDKRKKDKEEIQNEKPAGNWDEGGFRGTNLIRQSVSAKEIKKRVMISSSIIFAVLLILPSAHWSLSFLTKSKVSEVKLLAEELEILNQKKNSKNALFSESTAFKKRLDNAKLLLDRHVYFTNLFTFLENNTLPNVFYAGFSGDNQGTYSLSAVAKDFKNLTRQTEILRGNPMVNEVSVLGGDYSSIEGDKQAKGKNEVSGGIDFTLEIKLNKEIFKSLSK